MNKAVTKPSACRSQAGRKFSSMISAFYCHFCATDTKQVSFLPGSLFWPYNTYLLKEARSLAKTNCGNYCERNDFEEWIRVFEWHNSGEHLEWTNSCLAEWAGSKFRQISSLLVPVTSSLFCCKTNNMLLLKGETHFSACDNSKKVYRMLSSENACNTLITFSAVNRITVNSSPTRGALCYAYERALPRS